MVMRYSRQRAAILSFLQSRKDHPTAEFIYLNVKEEFPNISLGTVYRNLNQLADMGMIAKYHFEEHGTDHFDPNTNAHQHFVCNHCNAVIDLPMKETFDEFSYLDKEVAKNFDGLIQGHRLYFCGICRNCLDTISSHTNE